jgi:ribose-phosphate pyrophosphokinase
MILVGDVKGKDVLIIDDIIDSGGTLCEASALLKRNGAMKIYCYGTHGIFTKGTQELTGCFDKVMTSNTHYRENHDVTVIDVSSLFAEAIHRAQKGLSISELFK